MNYKRIFVLLISLGLLIQLNGQERIEVEPKEDFKHALGMSVGYTIGVGITYQYWINNFGVQANFAPAIDHNTTQYIGGLSFFYKLVSVEHLNLFLYQGNSYWYHQRERYNGIETTKIFNNGLGIGIEFVARDRVGLSIMGGYAARESFLEYNLSGEAILVFKF